jgi:hypothetical protein
LTFLVDSTTKSYLASTSTSYKVAKPRALGETSTSPTLAFHQTKGTTCLDDVCEVVTLSQYDSRAAAVAVMQPKVDVSEEFVSNIRKYVSVASLYRDNPFHNFEHACHVTMSVNKLLKRVVAPALDEDEIKELEEKGEDIIAHIHHNTHGINTDPLALFAIVFSALIHDVDHRGASNAQMMKEEESMSAKYKNKSIAEQNSLDIAWKLLLSEQVNALRRFALVATKRCFVSDN